MERNRTKKHYSEVLEEVRKFFLTRANDMDEYDALFLFFNIDTFKRVGEFDYYKILQFARSLCRKEISYLVPLSFNQELTDLEKKEHVTRILTFLVPILGTPCLENFEPTQRIHKKCCALDLLIRIGKMKEYRHLFCDFQPLFDRLKPYITSLSKMIGSNPIRLLEIIQNMIIEEKQEKEVELDIESFRKLSMDVLFFKIFHFFEVSELFPLSSVNRSFYKNIWSRSLKGRRCDDYKTFFMLFKNSGFVTDILLMKLLEFKVVDVKATHEYIFPYQFSKDYRETLNFIGKTTKVLSPDLFFLVDDEFIQFAKRPYREGYGTTYKFVMNRIISGLRFISIRNPSFKIRNPNIVVLLVSKLVSDNSIGLPKSEDILIEGSELVIKFGFWDRTADEILGIIVKEVVRLSNISSSYVDKPRLQLVLRSYLRKNQKKLSQTSVRESCFNIIGIDIEVFRYYFQIFPYLLEDVCKNAFLLQCTNKDDSESMLFLLNELGTDPSANDNRPLRSSFQLYVESIGIKFQKTFEILLKSRMVDHSFDDNTMIYTLCKNGLFRFVDEILTHESVRKEFSVQKAVSSCLQSYWNVGGRRRRRRKSEEEVDFVKVFRSLIPFVDPSESENLNQEIREWLAVSSSHGFDNVVFSLLDSFFTFYSVGDYEKAIQEAVIGGNVCICKKDTGCAFVRIARMFLNSQFVRIDPMTNKNFCLKNSKNFQIVKLFLADSRVELDSETLRELLINSIEVGDEEFLSFVLSNTKECFERFISKESLGSIVERYIISTERSLNHIHLLYQEYPDYVSPILQESSKDIFRICIRKKRGLQLLILIMELSDAEKIPKFSQEEVMENFKISLEIGWSDSAMLLLREKKEILSDFVNVTIPSIEILKLTKALSSKEKVALCLEMGVCTFEVTGDDFEYQSVYICHTCPKLAEDHCVCENCKKVCHEGHDLEEIGNRSSYCDCHSGMFQRRCLCSFSSMIGKSEFLIE